MDIQELSRVIKQVNEALSKFDTSPLGDLDLESEEDDEDSIVMEYSDKDIDRANKAIQVIAKLKQIFREINYNTDYSFQETKDDSSYGIPITEYVKNRIELSNDRLNINILPEQTKRELDTVAIMVIQLGRTKPYLQR